MKNLRISIDEELHRLTRIEAAKAGKSMSRYIADIIEDAQHGDAVPKAGGNPQLEALERFLAGPKLQISEDGRMPTAEERNARG